MIRVLFWLVLGVLAVAVLKRFAAGAREVPPPGASAKAARGGAPEDMVRCAVCSLNLPKSEALPSRGGWACCPDHVRPGGSSGHS